MRVLGWRDGPGNGEHDGLGHESAQQDLDETLIEDRRQKTAFSIVRENNSTAASRKRSLGHRLSLIHAAKVTTVLMRTRSTAGSLLGGPERLCLSLTGGG